MTEFWLDYDRKIFTPTNLNVVVNFSVERQNVRVESGFLLALQGLWEHCVQGNVVLMSIILLNQYFIQIF